MNVIQIRVFIAIAAAVWFVLLGISMDQALAAVGPYSIVCVAMAGVSYAFDNWLWKWPIINGLLAGGRRDISGTWQLELVSDYIDKKTNKQIPPIPGFMRIYQTYSTLTMRQMTKESVSDLLGARMSTNEDGTCEVTAIYRNTPESKYRHRSEIHYGGFQLYVSGTPASSISGQYFTDRKTTGDMKLWNRKKELYDDFESASSALKSPES